MEEISADNVTTTKTESTMQSQLSVVVSSEHLSITDIDAIGSGSIKEPDVPDGSDLLNQLDSEELTNLRRHFYEKKIDEKIKEPKGSAHPRFCGSKLKKDEFISAIENVLSTDAYEIAADKLFDQIVEHNAEEHKGFMWWEQILDEIIEFMAEKTRSRPWNIIKESFCRLYTMAHCKRETIVRVVPVETQTSFCYVIVSKYGKMGIYDWNMSLLEQYEVKLGTQIATAAGGEVRRTTWVTDALYMSDATALLVAASDRSLHVYSATGLVCVPIYHISGLPNTPTCLYYTVGATVEDPSMLLVGDDHGSITTMYFQQPHYALFKRTSNDVIDTYFWKELESQKAWVTITMDQEVHKDEVTRVKYFSDNNTVVSCSNDPNTTVIIRYLIGRRAPYIFRISRGVRCFHLDRSLKLLVTGGKDCVIRMWNPIIPSKPLASLFGHKTSIVDVRILKHLSIVLSMSKDTVLKVWDIVGQTCMQTLPLLFPVHGALARTPEFGVQTFYPGPVTCKNVFATSDKLETEVVFTASAMDGGSSSAIGKIEENTYSESITPSLTSSVSASGSMEVEDPTKTETMLSAVSDNRAEPPSTSCTGSPWTRMEVLLVCCNYVVILQLSERELGMDEEIRVGEPQPPPLRNQDAAVPSAWLTVDSSLLTAFTVKDSQLSTVDSETVSVVPPMVLDSLQKSLGEEMTNEFTALAATCHNVMDSQDTDLKKTRTMVEQCAPHLALNLSTLEDILFTPTVANTRTRTRSNQFKGGKSKGKDEKKHTIRASMVSTAEASLVSSIIGGDTSTTTSTTNPSNLNK